MTIIRGKYFTGTHQRSRCGSTAGPRHNPFIADGNWDSSGYPKRLRAAVGPDALNAGDSFRQLLSRGKLKEARNFLARMKTHARTEQDKVALRWHERALVLHEQDARVRSLLS